MRGINLGNLWTICPEVAACPPYISRLLDKSHRCGGSQRVTQLGLRPAVDGTRAQ